MQGLRSLRDGTVQPYPQSATGAEFPAGSYAYGLNVFLEATSGLIQNNSKRMERDFRLVSVNTANLAITVNWSLILGTEKVDWFGGFVRAECILGDAVLPHFLPNPESMVIEKGDSIMVQVRNDEAVEKHIALIFQGVHI
jgi:hypothetical protein